MPAPVVGAERGGASPGGEPAAHLEDAGGRGAGRHQPHLEDARNPPSRGVPPGRRDRGSGRRRRRRISGATRRALVSLDEKEGERCEQEREPRGRGGAQREEKVRER